MVDNLKHILFVLIIVIQIYMDEMLPKCETNYGKLFIILHHMLQLFFFFGSFVFGYHRYHLVLIVGAFLVHKIYRRCPITIVHNRMCGFDDNDPLITLINKIVPNYPDNLDDTTIVYYTLLILVFIYDVFYL